MKLPVAVSISYGGVLARYCFALAVRSRLVLLLLIGGLAGIAGSMILTWLTPGTERRTFFDIAYLGLEALAVLAPVLGSVALMIIEMDEKAIWLVLVRPPSRAAYVWGRFWGITFASWVVVVSVWMVLALLSGAARAFPEPWMISVLLAALMESAVIAAMAGLTVFVTTSYMTSLLVSLGVVLLGYLSDVLPQLAAKPSLAAFKPFILVLYWLLPHLSVFAVRDFAVPPEAWYLWLTAVYATVYSGAVLLASAAAFSRHES
jgi:ABC-type transport system involved in multi-copper enzyme maturation permease subunit